MTTEKQILEALSRVVDVRQVRNVKIQSGLVTVDLLPPGNETVRQLAKDAVEALPDVVRANVHLVSGEDEKPVSGLSGVKNIIAVSSCKGGVGKSTVAAMLARTLNSRGIPVGLLDADIYGPSVPTLFHLHHPDVFSDAQGRIVPVNAAGLKLMSFAFLTGDGPTVLRGPLVSQYVQQLLHNVAWGELDYLILDLPPGTGDIQLTVSQSVRIDGAVIVTTPHQLSLTDVRKGIMMFDKVNVPVLGVVENMAWFACDDCGKKHYLFGEAGAKSLEKMFGLETLAELPVTQSLIAEYADETTDAVIRALGKKSLEKNVPPEVSFDAAAITLKWPDGETVSVPNAALRKACACANCIDEMTHAPILDPKSVPDDIHALSVGTIGNYAITVDWSDGHNTGFFPYKTIRELAK
jgi:Mrp family chromosome partitioning ATPase/DUF971 family protein